MTLFPSRKILIWLFLVIAVYCSATYLLVFNREDSCRSNCVRGDISRLGNFHTSTIYVEFFGDADFFKFLGTKEEIAARFLKTLQQRANKRFSNEKIIFRLSGQGSSYVDNPLDLGIQLNIGAGTSARTIFTAQIHRNKYFDHYQSLSSSHPHAEDDMTLTRASAAKFLKGQHSIASLSKTINIPSDELRKNINFPIEKLADWIVGNMQPHAEEARKAEQHLKEIGG